MGKETTESTQVSEEQGKASETENQAASGVTGSEASASQLDTNDPEVKRIIQSEADKRVMTISKQLETVTKELNELKKKSSDDGFKSKLDKETRAFLGEGIEEEEVQSFAKAKQALQVWNADLTRRERELAEREEKAGSTHAEVKAQGNVSAAMRLIIDHVIPDEKSRGFLLKEAEALVQKSKGDPEVMEELVKTKASALREALSAALAEKPQPHIPDRGRATPGGGGGWQKLSPEGKIKNAIETEK